MRQRGAWRNVRRAVLLLMAIGLAALVAAFIYLAYASGSNGSLARLAALAAIWALALTGMSTAVALVRAARRASPSVSAVPSAVETFRAVEAVRLTSLALRRGEAEGHGLAEPIRVTWSRTRRPLTAGLAEAVGYRQPGNQRAGGMTSGDFSAVLSAYRRLANGRLVILGEAGAGKSALAVQLALGLLADTGGRDDPVAVLLPLSSWQPGDGGEHLSAWMAQRLAEDYPFLQNADAYGEGAALSLINSGRIMPVLDGLDELPRNLRVAAIAGVVAATAGRPVVVTCRSRDYEEALEAGGRILADDVIELHDVVLSDAADFLTQASSQARDRWSPVFACLTENPAAPLALAFRSPLMLKLAKDIYVDPANCPAELLEPGRYPDRNSIEQRLLDKFIPTIYNSRSQPASSSPAAVPLANYSPELARRWLTSVAQLLTTNGTADLAWWRLIDAVPRTARMALSTIAFTAFYAPTSAIVIGVAASLRYGISTGITVGLVAGACGGLPAGLGYGLAGELVGTPGPSLSELRFRPRSPNPVALAVGAFGFGITGAAIGGWIAAALLAVTGALIIVVWDIMESPADAGQFVDAASAFGEDIQVVRTRGIVFCLAVGVAGLFLPNIKTAIIGGIGFGLAGGIINGMGTKAWGRFTVARAWLVVTRQLPFRTRDFLEDARSRGALRHVGALYQFRHERLQAYLSHGCSKSGKR